MIAKTSQMKNNFIMKNINIFLLAFLIFLISCGQPYKEITPAVNENNIKVKLEMLMDKPVFGERTPFTLRIINTGERDLARCNLKFDDKYEHQLEGLINKSDDWEGKIKHSMLKINESVTLEFSKDFDNYSIFGITDNNFNIPATIELNCLDGKVIWKLK